MKRPEGIHAHGPSLRQPRAELAGAESVADSGINSMVKGGFGTASAEVYDWFSNLAGHVLVKPS